MAQIIRIFPTPGAAEAAATELKRNGFSSVETVEVPDRTDRGSRSNGQAVRVDAPFGTALKATGIMERNGGTEPGTRSVPSSVSAAASADPKAKHANGTTTTQPLSRDAELRTGPRTLSSMLGIPELISSDTYFSGFPLLIRPKPRHDEKAVPGERS